MSTKRAYVISCIILLVAGLSLSAAQPVITGVSIPDGSMKIGDVVPVTINVQSDATAFTLNASNIGGYALGGLSKQNDTTYTAQFTVNSGGTDYAAGDDIPTSVALADGGLTDTWTTVISQANDPIDANVPTVTITDDESGTANIAGGAVVYTFNFSETISGFTADDIDVANGSKGVFTPVSGTQFTLVVTPEADFEGDMTVDVAAGVATDALGNPNAAAIQSVQYVDTLAPFVTSINRDSVSPTNAGMVTYTVSFSEAVSDIEIGDFVLALSGTTGTVNGVTDSTGAGVTVSVNAVAGDGTLGLNFDYDKLDSVVDSEGNPVTADFTGQVYTIDNTDPTVTVNIVDGTLNDGDTSSLVTFEFSEEVLDFTLGSVDALGGSLDSFASVDADSYTALFTATDGTDITGSVTVNAGTYRDLADNPGIEGADTVDIDTLNPTISQIIRDDISPTNAAQVSIQVDFSESVDGVSIGNLSLRTTGDQAGASIDTVVTVGPSGVWIVRLNTVDDATGTLTLDLDSNLSGITDASGNELLVGRSADEIYDVDRLDPTVVVNIVDTQLTDTDSSSNVTFEFSEDVTGFTIDDLTPGNGTLSAFTTIDANSYAVTFTATDGFDGTGTVTVETGYSDSLGNPGSAGSDTVDIDRANPTVAVNVVDTLLTDSDNSSIVTFEFSEEVSGFTIDDLTANNGSVGSFTAVDADSYSVVFTADDGIEATGSVQVESSYTDLAGNLGGTGSDTVSIDTLNPSVVTVATNESTISDSDTPGVGSFDVTVAFDEAMDTAVAPTITFIPNVDSTLSFSSGSWSDSETYVASYDTADANVEEEVGVDVSGAQDASGNPQQDYAAGDDDFDIDTENPTVVVTIADAQLSDSDNETLVTLAFSSTVFDFTIVDLAATNGTLSAFTVVDAANYTVVFTADDGFDGLGSVAVGATYTDFHGNTGAAGSDTVDIDTENPTVTSVYLADSPNDDVITDSDTSDDTSATIYVHFSEPMISDGSADPAIVFSPNVDSTLPPGTVSVDWVPDGTIYGLHFSELDANVDEESVVVSLSGAVDAAGNEMHAYMPEHEFAIDTLNPTVTNISVSDSAISDADTPGVASFQIDLTFDEPMDQTVDPTIFFSPNIDSTLTFSHGGWDSSTAYEAHFHVADANVDEEVGIGVSGAQDANGNVQQDFAPGEDGFDIDTENPTVVVNIVDTQLSDSDDESLVTFTFSSTAVGFAMDDLTSTHGTLSAFTSIDGANYTAVFTADDDFDGLGSVAVGTEYTDFHGNTGAGGSDTVDIDTENPTVLSVEVDTDPIYEGHLTQVVTVTFSEPMDPGFLSEPSISFSHGSGFRPEDGVWSNGNTVWTESADFDDNDEDIRDVRVDITAAKDAVGNDQQDYTPEGEFDIDTVKPSVSSVDVSDPVISDSDTGGTFTIVVGFNEDMDPGTTPSLVFNPNIDSTLSLADSQWNTPMEFQVSYDVSDANVERDEITVDVTGAIDAAGNGQENYDPQTEFRIDTENPRVTDVSFAPSLVDDAEAQSGGGIDNFSVHLFFSEFMDGAQDPNITFSPDVSSTLTENPPANWSDDLVSVFYHVSDANVDIDSVVIDDVSGCYDLNGNVMQAYSTPDPGNDWFEIDTENPQATVTVSHDTIADGNPIYEGALVLTVTVTYNEPMDTNDVPAISVEGGTNWGSQSGIGWSGDTVYTATFTHNGTQEEIADAFARVADASGAHDEPADNTDLGDDSPVFDIDTKKPTAAITLSHTLIADANVGETFTVTLDYDETMNTGIAPTVVYDPGLGTTLDPETAVWTDTDTYVLTYTILDGGVTVNNDDVQVSSGRDLAGNLQNPANRNDLMIDTENPVISGATVIGGSVDDSCNRVVTFSATVTDPNGTMNSSDIAITSATETTGRAEYSAVYDVIRLDPTQATATISGKMDVHDLTSCPAIARVVFDAVDHVGNVAVQALDTDTVEDTSAPVIDPLLVDDDITVTVDCCVTPVPVAFSAIVTDNCCLYASNVFVTVELAEQNATLEYTAATDLTITQVDDRTVSVSGSAIVRCLTGCPARVVVTIEATDCCENSQTRESTDEQGRVYDRTAPEPLPDPYGYDDPGVRTLGRRDSDLLEVRFDDAAPPSESPYRLVVRESTPVRIDVLANDDDNCTRKEEVSPCQCCGTLWIQDIPTPPEFGVVAIVDGSAACSDPSSIRYLPNSGYIGRDKFSYRPADACGNLGPETWVYLEVVAAVLPEDVFLNTCQDGPIGIDILASDVFINHLVPEEIPFSFSIYDGFDHGILIGSFTDLAFEAPSTEEDPDTGEEVTSFDAAEYATLHLQYVPAAGYSGRDGLEVAFGDPWGMSETIGVEVWVSDSCAQAETAFRTTRGETVTILLPDGYAAIHDTAEGAASLICGASVTGIGEHGQVSWNSVANRYVLMLNTEGMPEGGCRLLIPIGNEEYVDLRFEVGEAR